MGNRLFCNESGVCPKAQVQHGVETELFDTAACDSAGAIFSETLHELNEVDRLLLLFSSSRNLLGVRWLIRLGANADACDTNGTTCLHTACRSGSVAIVSELLVQRKLSIDACDAAGWTALHVALFMGRRHISVMLMQRRCNPLISTSRGQRATELASDVWLREAVLMYTQCWERQAWAQWQPPEPEELNDVQVSSRLRFEPFFVPRSALMKEASPQLQTLSQEIFNQRPGQGLAFVVATGCIRDFPVELSSFLGQQGISSRQVGQFLGEDFALSQTLRLEFINSVRLTGTGVVTCLAKVFQVIVIPTEMVKIDRLVDGVAQIWWRQHEQLKKDDEQLKEEEVHGLELMKSLQNYDILHQLMFATILLHWNLYAPLPQSQRVTLEEWLQIGSGILRKSSELERVQRLIYKAVAQSFFPQLEIWKARASVSPSASQAALPPSASAWARIVVGFPTLALAGAQRVENYRHLRSILSESTGPALASPSPSRGPAPPLPLRGRDAPLPAGLDLDTDDNLFGLESPGPVGGKVWLALHGAFLFLAASPEPWAPYAFIRVAEAVVRTDNQSLLTLLPSLSTASSTLLHVTSPTSSKPGLQVVFLLPDGRWQVLEVPRFQVQFSDEKQLEVFTAALAEHCMDGPVAEWQSGSPISSD